MDETDIEILEMLEKNSREDKRKMARRMGIPGSTLYSRIKKMEKEGIIKRYRAVVDWKSAGYLVEAYVLIFVDTTVLKKIGKTQIDILKSLESIDTVEEGRIVTGDADILVKVRARDSEEFGKILLERIQTIEGITKTKTMFCLV